MPAIREAVGFQSDTVTTTAKTLTDLGFAAADLVPLAGKHPRQEMEVFVSVETQTVRWRLDGGTAGTASGHAIAADGSQSVVARDLSNFSIIAQSGTATLQVTVFRGEP